MSTDADESDLDQVATQSLIDEQRKRHDAILIVRMTRDSADEAEIQQHYGGSAITALGLARYAERWLLDQTAMRKR
jgi:hypothetical protein